MNLYSLFERAVGRFAQRPFLIHQGRVWTYAQMFDEVQKQIPKIRTAFPYFRRCHQGGNSPAFVRDAFATWGAGGIFVPLPPSLPSDTERYMRHLVRASNGPNPLFEPPFQDNQPLTDTALFLFTSGTTSTPKAVVLSHQNIVSNIMMIQDRIPETLIHEDHSSFAFLPWYHTYGLTCELLFLMSRGACIHLPSSTVPSMFMKELRVANPSLLFAVPRFLQKLRMAGEQTLWWMPYRVQKRLLLGKRIERLCVGGAKLDPTMTHFFHRSWDLPIHQGYGCTETSPMISLESQHDVQNRDMNHSSTCGQLLPHVDAYLDQEGKLCVRGPNVSHGYLLPDNTVHRPDHQFLPNGFFNTHDVCTLDVENRLQFQYRDASHWKLDNGKFVDPNHIENAILSLPGIDQCVIIGNHEAHVEVCIHSLQPVSPERLLPMIQKHLSAKGFAPYEIPKYLHVLLEPLSQNAGTLSLKQEPLRHVIQDMYFSKPLKDG